MAALDMSPSPSLGGTRALSRTQGLLIETMQLVEPLKKDVRVPNHLLESKIYSKLAGNDVIQARPTIIHFAGYELGKTHKQSLKLGNVSTELQRMHVIPPQTKYFYIKYTKNERLVPGMSLDCVIEFTPDEHRYYYDCVRVHCKGEENLVIPIHAYPVMDLSDFPSHVKFPPVPIGHRSTKLIPLRCNAPVDFEYQLTFIQPHPSFSVQPLMGVIPAGESVDITVQFLPTEFITAQMQMQLVISQFNSRPLICNVSGSSSPGLAKKEAELKLKELEDSSILDPRSITPVDRARKKRKSRQKITDEPQNGKQKGIAVNGIQFPDNLDTPYAVAQVLNQEPGKLNIKALREEMNKRGASGGKTRQLKEAVFEMAVRKDVYEERQNQLRWQVKIGDDQILAARRMETVQDRDISWREYQMKRGDPVEHDEYNRSCTKCTFRRTVRDTGQLGQEGMKFDTYTNDMWAVRHDALGKFRQAARKIIIRRRANKRIRGLRETLLAWGDRRVQHSSLSQRSNQTPSSQIGEEDHEITEPILEVDKVNSVTFPLYVSPDAKDDMAVDALGPVPVLPTQINLKQKIHFQNLKVPQHYKLMSYQNHNVHDASSGYVPPTPVRPLRTGAEDEIITLPVQASVVPKEEQELVNEGDIQVEDYAGTPVPSIHEAVTLRPPQAMFRPIEYPPLHIFNPAPGLQVFTAALPYAEVDPDFHLCPLPRYTSSDVSNPHMATQKQYLDREDVIKGVMTWKRFPSQGLHSLANTPTLTNVWVPRWNDPFSSDLLPQDVPSQLDALPPEDQENIQEELHSEEDIEAGLELTPEMVNAQFPSVDTSAPPEDNKNKKEEVFPYGNKLPSTNIPVSATGPVPREKREEELEFFLKKKYNRLGHKFKGRIATQDNLTSNPDLVLK